MRFRRAGVLRVGGKTMQNPVSGKPSPCPGGQSIVSVVGGSIVFGRFADIFENKAAQNIRLLAGDCRDVSGVAGPAGYCPGGASSCRSGSCRSLPAVHCDALGRAGYGCRSQGRVGTDGHLDTPARTSLGISYARTLETPFNENLALSSQGCGNEVLAPLLACSSDPTTTMAPGYRNEFHASLQQALGKNITFSGTHYVTPRTMTAKVTLNF